MIQDALLHADLLVWEGHARDLTLEERGGISVDRAPPFVVLQGCYTLDRSDPFILFERGTESIIATSAAIYSASGSAFARALFDSLLYGGDDLGTAVRNARNYLLAVTNLKKQRGHSDWTKTYRAALAFALWGDPTARPPLATPASSVPPATWRLDDHGLSLIDPAAPPGGVHRRPLHRPAGPARHAERPDPARRRQAGADGEGALLHGRHRTGGDHDGVSAGAGMGRRVDVRAAHPHFDGTGAPARRFPVTSDVRAGTFTLRAMTSGGVRSHAP